MSFSTLIDTQKKGSLSQPTQLGNHAVIFQIEGHHYALPLPNVERVLRMCAVTPVPEFPAWMPGVIDLHGEIVPVVDIGQRFGLPPRPIHPDARLLIVRTADQILALITDEVSEVLEIPVQEIILPPNLQENMHMLAGMIRWEDELILVLEAGADMYATKPILPEELLVCVKSVLGRHKLLTNSKPKKLGRVVGCLGAKGGLVYDNCRSKPFSGACQGGEKSYCGGNETLFWHFLHPTEAGCNQRHSRFTFTQSKPNQRTAGKRAFDRPPLWF